MVEEKIMSNISFVIRATYMYMQFLRNFRGTETGTYYVRIFEKRKRFQNG